MHNNYFFLKKLSSEIKNEIAGLQLLEAYSQDKEEAVFGFANKQREFFIHAHLKSNFSCLFFPERRSKARKNVANLFKNLIGKKVMGVVQTDFDRSFFLEFEDHYKLLFKLHGNRGNILLFNNSEIEEVFRSKLVKDHSINIESLSKNLELSKELFNKLDGDFTKLSAVFGKELNEVAQQERYGSKNLKEKWQWFKEKYEELNSENSYVTYDDRKTPKLRLLKPSYTDFQRYKSPIKCINTFFLAYQKHTQFEKLKSKLKATFTSEINKTEKYLRQAYLSLERVRESSNYKNWGDLIMANLHKIKAGSKVVMLDDFYSGEKVSILLKEKLNPQKNAEHYYRKSKNQKIEMEKLEQNIKAKEDLITNLQAKRKHLESLEDTKALKEFEKNLGFGTNKSAQEKPLKPYHEFIFEGHKIWVGKNAKKNDELTLKYANKNDFWLHAKDVSGSHVVIKEQAGKTIPKSVVEYAASLAAGKSKRKNEAVCPVIVTRKKFVRKPKGFPSGAVKVEKEEVIMVEPLV